jgi:hypothetical protein
MEPDKARISVTNLFLDLGKSFRDLLLIARIKNFYDRYLNCNSKKPAYLSCLKSYTQIEGRSEIVKKIKNNLKLT